MYKNQNEKDKDKIEKIMVKNAKRELQKVSAKEVEKAEQEHAAKMEAYFAEVGKVKESPEKAPVVHLFWRNKY